MRVLFLAHSFPRFPGDAAGSFLLRLARALQDSGIAVHVVAPAAEGFASTDSFEGVGVERFRYAPRRYERLAYTGNMAGDVQSSWSARLAMLGFLGSEFVSAVRARRITQPDLVHAHWWFPGGLVGTWVSGLSGVPLITTFHGSDVRLARTIAAARPPLRAVTRKSAAVTTVSHWLADELKQLVPSANPVVAPMPVDTSLFTEGGERSHDRLLFVGRLSAQKGIEHLIAALPRMGTAAELDVVGDGAGRPAVQRLASELGVSNRIRWLGALPQPQLVPLYQRAAAVAVPSIDEGLGLVAVEAMLCGAPVVAARSGGLTDVVRHESTGVLVPPADPAALAAALDELLARPERGRALAEAGRMHALATFAPESAARRYAGIYNDALAAAPA
ncbi:MAG: glycosyltransferase [Gemmatimonadaceae bacterium]